MIVIEIQIEARYTYPIKQQQLELEARDPLQKRREKCIRENSMVFAFVSDWLQEKKPTLRLVKAQCTRCTC